MARIINIYITDFNNTDFINSVIIKVKTNDEKIKYIKSTWHGYEDISKNDRHFNDILNKIENGEAIDFMKEDHDKFSIYTYKDCCSREKETIILNEHSYNNKSLNKQVMPIHIRKNNAFNTITLRGNNMLDLKQSNHLSKTNRTVTKNTLIEGMIRDLKQCYPDLKIKLTEKYEEEPENE